MNEFSNKDIYGFDVLEDPALRTTARNFEFKYVTRERIERIVRNVQHDRLRKRGDSIWKDFCKENCDRSVEEEKVEVQTFPNVRILNDNEIETMISSSVLNVGVSSPTSTTPKKQRIRFSSNESRRGSDSSPEVSPENSPRVVKGILVNKSNESSSRSRGGGNEEVLEEEIPFDLLRTISEEKIKEHVVNDSRLDTECEKVISSAKLESPHSLCSPKWVPTTEIEQPYNPPRAESDSDSDVEIDLRSSGHSSLVNLQNLEEVEQATSRTQCINSYTLVVEPEDEGGNEIEMKTSRICGGPDALYTLKLEDVISTKRNNPALTNRERLELQRVVGLKPPVPEVFEFPEEKSEDDYADKEEDYDVLSEEETTPVIKVCSSEPRTTKVQQKVNPANVARVDLTNCNKETTEKPQEEVALNSDRKIDKLKAEKMAIFSKITSFQDRIIDLIDKLRMSLLQLSLPESSSERRRRERNVLEFTARFARNYVYPVERMVEELRVTPKEDFVSMHSNEPCSKVCGLYGFLTQALQSYHKQIRYLLVDQSPRRLDTLVKFIHTATEICLKKRIFDRRDTVIQSIQERCTSFLGFMDDIQQHRKAVVQDSLVKSRKPLDTGRLSKGPPSKWNLTMHLNNLNMYEPKVVPKKDPKKRPTSSKTNITKPKSNSSIKLPPTAKSSQKNLQKTNKKSTRKEFVSVREYSGKDLIREPNTDAVDTQVEAIPNTESMCFGNSLSNLQLNRNEQSAELNQTVINALLAVTKDEMRGVLAPLLENLGGCGSQQLVESLLGKFGVDVTGELQQSTGNDGHNRNERTSPTSVESQLLRIAPAASKKTRREAFRRRASSSVSSSAPAPAQSPPAGDGSRGMDSPLSPRSGEICGGDRDGDERPQRKSSIARIIGSKIRARKRVEAAGADSAITSGEEANVQKLNYNTNVQYTFVKSNKAPVFVNENENRREEQQAKEDLSKIFESRSSYLKSVADNPLYVNENFPEPWKLLTKMSNKLSEEVLQSESVLNVSLGEERYLQDFLRMEFQM